MTTAVGFSRPKRFCVPENRNYTAVETKALDALEAACEQAIAAMQADKIRMRDRIERLRGALKTCAGRFLEYNDLHAHEDCMRWADDMEPPL